MSLLTTIRMGRSALNVASAGVEVVGRNVSNANTDGYHRKELVSTTASPVQRGGLWTGQGVVADSIVRLSDSLLGRRQTDMRGEVAFNQAAYNRLFSIEAAFSEQTGTGIADRLDAFFDAIEAATADPSNFGYRMEIAETADSLSTTIRGSASTLNTMVSDLDAEIGASVASVNSLVAQLATIQSTILANADTSGQSDLLDQRDAIVAELADTVGMGVRYNSDNTVTLVMGGVAVLSRDQPRELSWTATSATSFSLTVAADSGFIDVTSEASGEIGGWLAARGHTAGYSSSLNLLAQSLADQINAVQALGFDGYGAPGAPMFSYTAGSEATTLAVQSALLADPRLVACGTTADAGDSSNLQAMSQIQQNPVVAGMTLAGYLSSLYTTAGYDVTQYETAWDSTSASLDDMNELEASVSGVDLDEEAANLIEWQAAYQAASRVIDASNNLLQELLGLVR